MLGHVGSSAGSYLADPTSPIPSHCAVIILVSKCHSASIAVTTTVRVNQSTNWSARLWINQSINQWVSQCINQSTNQLISQSMNQWVDRSINQPTDQRVTQCISQPSNLSVNELMNQSTNQPANQWESICQCYVHRATSLKMKLPSKCCRHQRFYLKKSVPSRK